MDSAAARNLTEVIHHCFAGKGGIPIATIIDALDNSVRQIAEAITPDAAPGRDASGVVITSLTEAVMGVTSGLHAIADAIHDHAEAIRSK